MKNSQLVPSGGGTSYDYSQDHCFVKVASRDTDGQLAMVEDRLKPGFRLGRHYHKQMTEVFYVLEGEIEFIFDDQTMVIKSGDTLTIPPNVWHEASCKGGGRMLTVFQNGRFDEYLERLNSMTEEQFQDAQLMRSLAEEFDIYES